MQKKCQKPLKMFRYINLLDLSYSPDSYQRNQINLPWTLRDKSMLAAGQPTIFNHSWPKYSCWSTKRYIFFWLSMAVAQGREAILDAILPFLQTKAKGVSTFKEELQSYSHIGDTSFFFSDSCRKSCRKQWTERRAGSASSALSVFKKKQHVLLQTTKMKQ